MDLVEAEDLKKRWQEYTEELCQKDLHDTGNQLDYKENSAKEFLLLNCGTAEDS